MKQAKEIGMIGLGRMGANMARRMARGGAKVIAWDRAAGARRALAREPRVAVAPDLASLLRQLKPPRLLWLMLPAGKPSEDLLARLVPQLARGDVLVDGANAHYQDSMRRAAELATRGLCHVDAGRELIRARLAARQGHYMNPTLLDSQFGTLERPGDALRLDAAESPAALVRSIRNAPVL